MLLLQFGLCRGVPEHVTLVAIASTQFVDLQIFSFTPLVSSTISSPSDSPHLCKVKISKSSGTGTGIVFHFMLCAGLCEECQLQYWCRHF